MNRVHIETGRQCGKSTACGITIIAFTGKTDVGKDTAAAVLVNHCSFVSIAFGDALRREISAAWHIDERLLTHRPTKELSIPALAAGMCSEPAFIAWICAGGESLQEPRSPRWVMQRWADFQRRFRPSYYADIVARWIGRQAAVSFRRFAVTDLRDPIEEAALRALGARLSVVRIHKQQRTSELAEDTASHRSERHQLTADFDVSNDASLESLRDNVLQLPPVRGLVDARAGSAQHAGERA